MVLALGAPVRGRPGRWVVVRRSEFVFRAECICNVSLRLIACFSRIRAEAEHADADGVMLARVVMRRGRHLSLDWVSISKSIILGDHSACAKPPVDFKTKVPLWPCQARADQAKAELLS